MRMTGSMHLIRTRYVRKSRLRETCDVCIGALCSNKRGGCSHENVKIIESIVTVRCGIGARGCERNTYSDGGWLPA